MANKEALVTEIVSISRADKLAVERTRLANERTFLAYARSGVVMLGSGLAIIKIPDLRDLYYLGVVLLVLAPIFLLFGLQRFFLVNHRINETLGTMEKS